MLTRGCAEQQSTKEDGDGDVSGEVHSGASSWLLGLNGGGLRPVSSGLGNSGKGHMTYYSREVTLLCSGLDCLGHLSA